MDNRGLRRLALISGMLISAAALVRFRPAIIGFLPRILKNAVKESVPYRAYRASVNRRRIAGLVARGEIFGPLPTSEEAARILRDWDQEDRPLPGPSVFKQSVLRAYAQEFGLMALVETGTFTGDTPAALKDAFRRIYSVELNAELVRRVRERFRNDAHITILHGDSAERLPEVLAGVREPTLFWLDGHYSGGITSLGSQVTPILGELEAILAHPVAGHVILIDDARDFQHEKGHPTLEELQAFIAARRPELGFEVEDDIIRLTPTGAVPT